MKFTVLKLHKALGKLIAEGHGRKPVLVDKPTFTDNCEDDGCVILELCGLGVKWVGISDGDGGTKWNKDGSEAGHTVLVLAGCSGANSKGELIEASR